ncbi:MAG TPA: amidase [Thermoflexales bacterium]|nr:amidase [Anaerolineae bacterium]HQV27330.1 amidase [Thermoflexales bacterium]HQX09274.1 amidase [Thermoflexales bacterium]HQY23432.1 amidase [Thermoflexales bacterium]HQZ52305.1 amidase [Thermoflexales bacterium]
MKSMDLCFLPALEQVGLIKSGQLSARELLEAHLTQIGRVNPAVNAIVTLDPEGAREQALAADEAQASGATLGPLHGLPVAHKDLLETRGMLTTYGSPIHRDYVPDFDALLAERISAAGAIRIGKTNTPEFGAGSQTFNPVFGATRNPYNLSKTVGGSSGGAAAALACGMIPIADGSDMGGSLRNPASFCNVVGLRPSPGRVPAVPQRMGWFTLSVEGPMARTVGDVALLLSAIAGPDPRAPLSLSEPGSDFGQPLEGDLSGARIAWAGNLGLPFDPEVLRVVNAQRRTFEALGCVVEDARPDLSAADAIFKTLRAWSFYAGHADNLRDRRGQLKRTIIDNAEHGARLSGADVAQAEIARTQLFLRVTEFMRRYDFIVLPTVQVPPFDVTLEYPTEIDGAPMESYIDWMRSCYYISTIGNPALSVPAGFTRAGLPVGLQIVGRHHDDWGVLQLGFAYEAATALWKRRPNLDLIDTR